MTNMIPNVCIYILNNRASFPPILEIWSSIVVYWQEYLAKVKLERTELTQ